MRWRVERAKHSCRIITDSVNYPTPQEKQGDHRDYGDDHQEHVPIVPRFANRNANPSYKTEAGVRVVDLTPALRDELAVWLDRSPHKRPTDLVFPTLSGKPDNRNNVKRFLSKTIERANKRLAELGLEPIEHVTPHGLRRTYASLRHAVGDDVAYTSAQLGHESPDFTLRVYVQETKRRERLTDAERREYDRAVEWAQMGTNNVVPLPIVASADSGSPRKSAAAQGSSEWSVPGSNR